MRTRYTLFKSETEPIVIVMAILLVTGTINVFSSSYVLAAMNFENPYYFLQRHLQWLLLGTVACWLCRRINYQRLRGLMFIGLGINLFLLVAVLFVGTTINGAQRWIALGPLSFQPAEFAKLMGVLMGSFSISAVLAKERFRMDRDWPRVAIPFGAILLMAFLVYREPDFGTACIVFGVPLCADPDPCRIGGTCDRDAAALSHEAHGGVARSVVGCTERGLSDGAVPLDDRLGRYFRHGFWRRRE